MRETIGTVDGGVERRRVADTDADRAQLRHEATLLGLACHPAVVEVRAASAEGEQLTTRARATLTLDQLEDQPAGQRPDRLAVLASAAQAVADLHALGLVHGGLRASCLWVDPRGTAILDGFDRAGLAGSHRGDGSRVRPTDDVAALAGLIEPVGTEVTGVPRPIPSGPTDPGRTGGGRRGRRARATVTADVPRLGPELAAVLRAGQGGSWPPARRLAAALEAEATRRAGAIPPARAANLTPTTNPGPTTDAAPTTLPTRPLERNGHTSPTEPTDPVRPAVARPTLRPGPSAGRRVRRGLLIATVGVVGLLALAWGATSLLGRPARPSLAADRPPEVQVAGATYQIGLPGDQVRVGRWACHPPRAVVLRPSTGEVFAFPGWARPGHDLDGRLVARVPPRSRLVTSRSSDGCDRLGAVGEGGGATDLDAAVTR